MAWTRLAMRTRQTGNVVDVTKHRCCGSDKLYRIVIVLKYFRLRLSGRSISIILEQSQITSNHDDSKNAQTLTVDEHQVDVEAKEGTPAENSS